MKVIICLLALIGLSSLASADHFLIQSGKCFEVQTQKHKDAHAHVKYLQSQGFEVLEVKPFKGQPKEFAFLKQAIAAKTNRSPASANHEFEKNILEHTKIEAKLKKQGQLIQVLDTPEKGECLARLK